MKTYGIEVKPPNIREETLKEMAKFFMKTSVPRIINDSKKVNTEK